MISREGIFYKIRTLIRVAYDKDRLINPDKTLLRAKKSHMTVWGSMWGLNITRLI